MPSISLVVRALNEAEHIGALLSGAARQAVAPDEIVLVDSGSTDGTVSIAHAHGAKVVHIAPESFSFGRALNVGCRAATGEVLVFASAHVYPIDDRWIERITQPFSSPDVALVYGRQRGDSRTQFSEQQVMRRWFPEDSEQDQRHPFCNNANCAVRRSIWEDNPYDEELTGLEDLDWAQRVLESGYSLTYAADAGVVHVHQETFAQTINRYRREAIAHKRIFGEQSISGVEAASLFAAHCIRDYVAAKSQRILLPNLWSIPQFRAAQLWGSYRGFSQRGEVATALKRRFYYPEGFGRSVGRSRAPGNTELAPEVGVGRSA